MRPIIGKATVKVKYLSTEEIMETTIDFEQTKYGVFYFYTFRDKGDSLVAARSQLVSDKLYNEENKLQKVLAHVSYNIDNFLVNRKRIFTVIEANVVQTEK